MKIKQFDKMKCLLLFLGILSFLLYSFCFEYGDGRTLTVWSYNIWDALFNQKFFDFYEITLENMRGAQHFMCGWIYFPLIPLAIWNFPMWVICKICGIINVSSGFFLIWTKIFYFILLGCTIYRMYNISQLVQEKGHDFKKYIFLLMFGSTEILFSISYAGQDEIVYIFFFIQALYYHFRKDKNKFYFYSILSIMCCEIMLVPYVLLILFDDKIWYSILSKILLVFLPNQIFGIFYARNMRFRHFEGDNFLEWYFGRNVITTGWGHISLLAIIIIFVFAYVFFYQCKNKTNYQINRDKLFCMAILICAITFLSWDQFYRTFIWLPFVVLYIVNFHHENIQINLLIVISTAIIRTLMSCMTKPVLFRPEYISNIFGTLLEKRGTVLNNDYTGILNRFITSESQFYTLMNSAVIGAIIILFFINSKEMKEGYKISYPDKLLMTGYFLVSPFLFLLFLHEVFL